jgi:NAD(P)-dependent dehydrogenase (short-subunit alcohol dehydrogenase family)
MSEAPDPARTRQTGVILTGGSSGLGRATALLLAQAARPVAVWGTNRERTTEIVRLCQAAGEKACGITVDVCDFGAVRNAVHASEHALGSVGGVVCAAARLRSDSAGHMDFGEWDLTLRTNLTAIAHTLEAALPALRKVGRGASFVAVASTEAIRGSGFHASYSVSKHGVLGLVSSASRALAPEGIRINAVCAGAMDTPMMAAALEQNGGEAVKQQMITAIPLGYIADPKEVAHVINFLLSPESSYVTGAAIPVDGGMLA